MTRNVVIWHNPRCSKSRATLALLREQGVEPEIVEYLKTPPDRPTLEATLARLGIGPQALMRDKEAAYKDMGPKDADDARAIDAMVAHPILIERPVVFVGDRAVLGRPPKAVLDLLNP